MKLPLQITFHQMEPSEALEAQIRDHAGRLDRFHEGIISCRVLVEASHRRHHKGNLYRVRIDLTVPGKELVVTRDPPEHQSHQDPYVSIRDAFDAVRRQLEDHARVQRAATKVHEPLPRGKVARLFPEEHYGFVETDDRREIYFHRNAVVGESFEKLAPGTEVEFVEEAGEKGPQASTVHVRRLASPRT
jgi:ribosomal subunit interface protein